MGMESAALLLVLRDGRLSFDACFSCRVVVALPLLAGVLAEAFRDETLLKPEKVLRFCFLRSAVAASSRAVFDGLSQELRLSLTMAVVKTFNWKTGQPEVNLCHSLQGDACFFCVKTRLQEAVL